MATTGFWPVKGRLKEVIDYANNPDKTTAKEYLDEDLYAAIRYVENDDKTDQMMFVSGINCSKHNAYNEMIAVKRRFGERGKNIAYHGYQSFATGEVTPDEAYAIGMETARQMWGARYQVVVTTHLNTDNIHNHFVINSVSFVDGKKFRNGIGDRLELRKISDAICAARNKSVIQSHKFYSNKKEYWMHRMVEEGKIGTIIVKDLSRFGREHIEGDRLAEIVYPTLGVTFISIHENINTSTGEGMEMLPFYNIFNEWYAAQTSKKIRAVWQSKSDNGERVSATVAFGYKKADDDSKQWVIDEPAAKVVRYIFQLCIEGLGVTKIARRLEAEKILTPTAYYNSIGRKTRNKVIDPYRWSENSVDHILANMQYTGCTVNFKSSTVSFKVHKTVYNSPEDWVIIPNTQEAIIDMDTWERVQEIKKHRRRNTATGRQSIFSGLMYCGDCGSKLYFCAAKSVKEHQEFYRCSAYKENKGSCTIHFIRNVVLERMVLKLIREAAEYITEYEPIFLYLYGKQHELNKTNNFKAAKQELEKNKKRIAALDKLIQVAFEKNVLGTLRDDLFERMIANYEQEQRELIQAVAELEQRLANAEQDNIDLRAFLSIIRKCTDLKKLTPELVNRLITKIEVFDSTKDENGKKHVPIKVHFIGVGILDIPDAQTIIDAKEEIRKNPPRVA